MPEYLDNPRRAVRAPIRCRALVLRPSGATESSTEDIGARGCQLILPDPCARGDVIGLAISARRHPRTLRLSARVAWVSPRPPWRVGVAFVPESLAEAARWMETLIAVDPSVLDFRRPPERVALDATVYLGLAPGETADFTPDEVAVLRTVGLGLPLRLVRERLAQGWPRMQRAIFSLLTRQALTLSRAASSHPRAWRAVLGPEAPPVSRLGDGVYVPPGASAPEAFTPPPEAHRAAPAQAPTPAVTAPDPGAVARPAAARASAPSARHQPDFSGAGVGWRNAAGPRSPQAQDLFNHGLAELELKRPADALTYLRRALALAPGDPEIATAIGRALTRESGT